MKYLSGGYQTTINSTITELFPALAFNNGRKLSSADQMYDYILDLAKKKQLNTSKSGKSFVNKGDIDSGYEFVRDTAKIRPSMLQEKFGDTEQNLVVFLKVMLVIYLFFLKRVVY